MKWIGKHPVFSDLLIGGVLLTPPDPQYEYELTLPNDDGTAGQVLTTDGNGVLTWVTNSAGGTGVSMTNGVDNRIMTATAAQAITGEANLTYSSTVLTINGDLSGNLPAILINNDNAGSDGGILKFNKLQDGSDNDELGIISWYGDDDGGNQLQFASITGRVADATDTDEGGKLELKVATNSTETQQALTATGLGTSSRVDVGIAHGASSTTAIAGEVTLGVDLAITHGGTGESTAQAAIDALTAVSGASTGEVLVKDGSGNATWAAQTDTTYSAGDGLDLTGTTFSTDLKSNGGLAIESTELAVDLGASSITGTLAVGDGGTGLTTIASNNVVTGNGTSALTAESDFTYGAVANQLKAGMSGSRVKFGNIYGSGFPSPLAAAAGTNIIMDGYSLFATPIPTWLKVDSAGAYDQADFYIEAPHASGTDKSGGDIILVGGPSTGSDASGGLKYYGHPGGGGSGFSVNNPSQKFSINGAGDTTVGGDLTIQGGDITIGATAGEIVATGQHILKQTKTVIDQAGCNALNSSPQTLVTAQGADTIIIPVSVTCLVDRNSADTSASSLIVGWNGTTSYTYALKYVRRFMYGILTDMTFVLEGYASKGAASLTGGKNVALTISTDVAISSNSLTSMVVYTSYYVIGT